jgi:cell division septum initiation protein DivIVA
MATVPQLEHNDEDHKSPRLAGSEKLPTEHMKGKNLSDLIYSDMHSLVAFILIVFCIIVIFTALIVGAIMSSANTTASQTTSSVLQIMSAVLLAVVGFYFGSKGTQKAQEVAENAIEERENAKVEAKVAQEKKKEVEERIENVQREKTKAEKIAEALKLQANALDLHYMQRRDDAREKYLQAVKLVENNEPSIKAQILTNFVYLLLDYPNLNYRTIERYSKEAFDILKDKDVSGFWFKLCSLARAVVLGQIGHENEALELLNAIASDIEQFAYLFDEDNLRHEHFSWIKPVMERLTPRIAAFLGEKEVINYN